MRTSGAVLLSIQVWLSVKEDMQGGSWRTLHVQSRAMLFQAHKIVYKAQG
jgi:hypothetical protein